jgi:transposase InsO family protein
MRNNSSDLTLDRNYIQKWRFLIGEYEAVKAGTSDRYRRVGEFYRAHGTCSQTFRKYYNRYLQNPIDASLVPQKRGPRWKRLRTPPAIEAKIVEQRQLGLNRYEIHSYLRETIDAPPSLSTIYRLVRRHGLNRLTPPMIEAKRRIIKDKLGELGHVDLHQLPADCFMQPPQQTHYVICLIDACSRLAWAEVVASKKALPVMFKTLKMINTLNVRYAIAFTDILSDNGAEFASRANPAEHPFEAMLQELGIRHRYTRPYRPQTNGKAERFWRTLDYDLIEGTTFNDIEELSKELLEYIIFYNEFRPHQALNGLTPKQAADSINAKSILKPSTNP